jgi:hypothetical protein
VLAWRERLGARTDGELEVGGQLLVWCWEGEGLCFGAWEGCDERCHCGDEDSGEAHVDFLCEVNVARYGATSEDGRSR